MRIISGKFKGKKLKGYDLKGTRPTMDRVKESLFATIQNKVPNSLCLDLFAGSGNLGIEALSLGALEVIFVDKEYMAVKTINDNLSSLNIDNYQVLKLDYLKALEYLKDKKFDIIFLDPPYKTDYLFNSLQKIKKLDLLDKEGIVILESDDLNKLQYDNYYKELKTKKYGDKLVRILQKNN